MDNEKEIPKPIEAVPPAPKSAVVKTYAEDMASAMDHVTPRDIKNIIQQEEESLKIEENISPQSTQNKTLMIISVVLILAALAGVFFAFFIQQKKETVEVKKQSSHILFVDKNIFLDIDGLTKNQVIQSIVNESINTTIRTGDVESIYLLENNNVIGWKRFLELTGIQTPQEILDNTEDDFMIGVHKETTNSIFFLLKVKSFTDIFPGMKLWETSIFESLHSFFGKDINIDTKYLLTKDFENNVVLNKNSRILKDNTGATVLEYIFAEENAVVIISNEETANEIMLRLAANRLAK